MSKIMGQESPSKNTQILYRRSRQFSNAISTVVNIHSSKNHRARFALDRKIRRDNKGLGRSTIMVDDHRVLKKTREITYESICRKLHNRRVRTSNQKVTETQLKIQQP